jgi:hypothetical protein
MPFVLAISAVPWSSRLRAGPRITSPVGAEIARQPEPVQQRFNGGRKRVVQSPIVKFMTWP